MALLIARLIVIVLGAYALIGVVFAIAFVTSGVTRVDRNVTGSTRGFRLIIIPGVAALWPVMFARWIAAGRPHRTAPVDSASSDLALHLRWWLILPPLLVVAFILALINR